MQGTGSVGSALTTGRQLWRAAACKGHWSAEGVKGAAGARPFSNRACTVRQACAKTFECCYAMPSAGLVLSLYLVQLLTSGECSDNFYRALPYRNACSSEGHRFLPKTSR